MKKFLFALILTGFGGSIIPVHWNRAREFFALGSGVNYESPATAKYRSFCSYFRSCVFRVCTPFLIRKVLIV